MLDTNLGRISWQILATILLCGLAHVYCATKGQRVKSSPDIPLTQFTCAGRPPGYYADVETGCQVYHMCTEGGNQFSYKCPNTTLFQQRMLICAHWYQVNCSRSEQHYGNNLLIGQRDKPFVNDDFILTKNKQLNTLQNPEILQNLGQAGSARQGKAQATNENAPANRVFQNNLKRDQESSVRFNGNSVPSPSPSTTFQTVSRRAQEDLASLPLAGSVIPGGLKSIQLSRTTPQGTTFIPSFQSSTPFQQNSPTQAQFQSRAPPQIQHRTQPVSFIPTSSPSSSGDNINIFSTTASPFTNKFSTQDQNKYSSGGFKKQPVSNFKPGPSTSKPGFEFIPPPGQSPSVDLAVASQENAVSSRTKTTPQPEAEDESEIGGGLPEIETTIKAIIEQPINGSLPADRFNTFIKRFNPFEEPPQQTTEREVKTEQPEKQEEKQYHTFINRFIPDQTLSSSHTNLGQPIEEHVFINRFVLTPEELAKEKDRVQVENLHNLLPPDDQVTISFPNFDLIPPVDDSADSESNKIELHLQDPRRTFFIPSADDSSFSKADAAPIVVTIPLHSQDRSPPMWFRKEDSTDPCARCHPSFLVNKETCMPCVIIR